MGRRNSAQHDEVPRIKTEIPGPKSKAVLELFNKYRPPSLSVHPPLVWEKATGATVEDLDGNVFIDFSSGIAVSNTGHCNPWVVEAIKMQAEKLLNCYDHATSVRAELQKELAEMSPTDLKGDAINKVHLVSGGSEGVDFSIKLSRRFSKKFEIITTHGAFHGRGSIQTMALTDDIKYRKGYGPMPPGILHVPYAYCYRCAFGRTFPGCDILCADYFEHVYEFESTGDIAAFIVEPIQGASGYVLPPDEYLRRVKDFCNKHGIQLIDDEIQAGLGRTGKLFAIEYSGVKPDIMILGKALGGGVPISAIVARQSVIDSMSPGDHSTTYGGNPLSCSAALANIRGIHDNDHILKNALEIGKHMIESLREMQERHPMIGDVRGRGLMIGVELVKDRIKKVPASDEMKTIRQKLYSKGLIMVPAGLWGSVLRVAPPLIITRELADTGLDILDSVLSEVEENLS
jgi:4-aminobutyrate aminotransferase / (S)-3-amino-2-methylpropionate transaminase / 5-aminovalerate transaminase